MSDGLRNNTFSPFSSGVEIVKTAPQEKNGVCDYKMVWSCLIVHPVRNSVWSLCVFPDRRTCKQWVVAFTFAARCYNFGSLPVFLHRFNSSSRSDAVWWIYSSPLLFWMDVVHWLCFCAICNGYIWWNCRLLPGRNTNIRHKYINFDGMRNTYPTSAVVDHRGWFV